MPDHYDELRAFFEGLTSQEVLSPKDKEELFKRAFQGQATYEDLRMLAPLLGFGSESNLIDSGQVQVMQMGSDFPRRTPTLYQVSPPGPPQQVTDPEQVKRLKIKR